MEKSALAASAVSVLLFVLMFLLWPVTYSYTATVYEQSCPSPGSAPGIYNCPEEAVGKTGGNTTIQVVKKAPFITERLKSGAKPRIENLAHTLLVDGFVSIVSWLLVYEALDKFRHSPKTH
jgi:hypothetical protein